MIITKNLCKTYTTGSEQVNALSNINIEIKEGEIVAFAGPSGSGKTTLLNLIGTLDSISDGDIEFNGKKYSVMSEKEKTLFRRDNLGFIFQSYNLIPVLTALENVDLAFKPFSKKELAEKGFSDSIPLSKQALSDVDLSDYANRKPSEMSGGQQQRVSIARAIVRRPSLILADEPTANLDSNNSRKILFLMKELNRKYGITVIYSSHDQEVLESVDRIITLKDGVVVGDESKC